MKYLLLLIPVLSYSANNKVCEEIRTAMLATIKAGATVQTISKGADDLYSIVSGGKGAHCNYIRYSFRTLKKPYNGKEVSPKDWDRAIINLRDRKE